MGLQTIPPHRGLPYRRSLAGSRALGRHQASTLWSPFAVMGGGPREGSDSPPRCALTTRKTCSRWHSDSRPLTIIRLCFVTRTLCSEITLPCIPVVLASSSTKQSHICKNFEYIVQCRHLLGPTGGRIRRRAISAQHSWTIICDSHKRSIGNCPTVAFG